MSFNLMFQRISLSINIAQQLNKMASINYGPAKWYVVQISVLLDVLMYSYKKDKYTKNRHIAKMYLPVPMKPLTYTFSMMTKPFTTPKRPMILLSSTAGSNNLLLFNRFHSVDGSTSLHKCI